MVSLVEAVPRFGSLVQGMPSCRDSLRCGARTGLDYLRGMTRIFTMNEHAV